ncbi:MAG: hypothetical protein GY949_08425 [Gammaproteobacteria bacterium]|nr:hypothetical protein [Gammaproteobacteria bacterium]
MHWSFWVISVVALLWNLMGVINFSAQMSADLVATYPETHRAIIEGRSAWATAAFAVAVFGGALGCLLLLFRNASAFYLFVASLFGVILTMIRTLAVVRPAINFSAFEIFMMILMPLVVAAFLLWYSKQAEKKDWIK